jgi:hypothetical protein
MLASALDLDARHKTIARRTLILARAGRYGSLNGLVRVVGSGQLLAASTALAAVPRMLAEQGIDTDADAKPLARSLTYVASDGRSIDGLMDYTRAPEVTQSQFDLIVLTQMSDVARSASVLGSAVRPAVTGYVRMLETPSCSRCVVLAGKVSHREKAFQRHPKCDCRNIPTSENVAGDLTTDPAAHFDSLSKAEQDRVFTKAGAEAIRNGADIGKVVNARRGMSTAQTATGRLRQVKVDAFGRPIYQTTEGMTKRGAAHGARGGRNYIRLMPESIVEMAGGNRAELLRLLKSHGYLT